MFMRLSRFVAAFALAGACASVAHADITAANWIDDTHFNYRVQHMPDLDQRRYGDAMICDGDGYCFPTAAVNVVAYIANHGFASVAPGPHYWEGQTNYDLATTSIELMGMLMETECGGTGGNGSYNGMASWLAGHNEFVINDHKNLASYSTDHRGIGLSLCGGRIGRVGYGKYDIVGDFKGIPLVDRVGGHCTTAIKVRRNGDDRELWVRDPWSNEDPTDYTMQSEFRNDSYTLTDLLVINAGSLEWSWMTALNYEPGDTTLRLVDGHSTVRLKQGYSWSSSLGAVVFLGSMNLANPGLPPVSPFPSPSGNPVSVLAWQELTGEVLAVSSSGIAPPVMHAINPLNGAAHAVSTAIPPALVAVGRSDDVFLCSGNLMTKMLYPTPAPPVPSPGQPTITLPHVAAAMIYDDGRDDVVLASRSDRKLMRVSKTLMGAISIRDIPTIVPLGTRVQLAVNPQDPPGVVWLWSSTSNSLWRLEPVGAMLAATPFTHSAIPQPRGFDFDDAGHMFVSNNGLLVELAQSSSGAWTPVSGSRFAGLPADASFRMLRSRTNFTPGVHDTPGWTASIDPSEFPAGPQPADCLGDIAPLLDIDEVVNIDDLLVVIGAWGPCASSINCPADVNDDNTVNINDLLTVIGAWGPCP